MRLHDDPRHAPLQQRVLRPMASTTSTCHADSCESAAVISAQLSLNSSTMMPVSAASTSSEITVFCGKVRQRRVGS